MTVRGRAASAARDDGGVGVISSASALLVTILFLTLAVQVLLGLYATTTLRAALHGAASSAASEHVAGDRAQLALIAGDAEASLGRMGDRTAITLEPVDADGDGTSDVIAGEAVGAPPRVVPGSVSGMVGVDEIRVGVRVRIEQPR